MTVYILARAKRDLRKLETAERRRITEALRSLDKSESNLDIKPLRGASPWQRMRVGTYRVVYRPNGSNIIVARIVHRRELERAVTSLA